MRGECCEDMEDAIRNTKSREERLLAAVKSYGMNRERVGYESGSNDGYSDRGKECAAERAAFHDYVAIVNLILEEE